MVDENGDVIVGDFVVGREGFGMVKFFGEFNVAGMNLDEIGKLLFCFDMICSLFQGSVIVQNIIGLIVK